MSQVWRVTLSIEHEVQDMLCRRMTAFCTATNKVMCLFRAAEVNKNRIQSQNNQSNTLCIHASAGVTRGMYSDLYLVLGGAWECNRRDFPDSPGGHRNPGIYMCLAYGGHRGDFRWLHSHRPQAQVNTWPGDLSTAGIYCVFESIIDPVWPVFLTGCTRDYLA